MNQSVGGDDIANRFGYDCRGSNSTLEIAEDGYDMLVELTLRQGFELAETCSLCCVRFVYSNPCCISLQCSPNAPIRIGAQDLPVGFMNDAYSCYFINKKGTINDRKVDLYLNTVDDKVQGAESAEEADTSLSKLVQACVEFVIAQGGPDFLETGGAGEDLQELQTGYSPLSRAQSSDRATASFQRS